MNISLAYPKLSSSVDERCRIMFYQCVCVVFVLFCFNLLFVYGLCSTMISTYDKMTAFNISLHLKRPIHVVRTFWCTAVACVRGGGRVEGHGPPLDRQSQQTFVVDFLMFCRVRIRPLSKSTGRPFISVHDPTLISWGNLDSPHLLLHPTTQTHSFDLQCMLYCYTVDNSLVMCVTIPLVPSGVPIPNLPVYIVQSPC